MYFMKNYFKIFSFVLMDSNLSPGDKIVFSVIHNLTFATGYCFASNRSLSRMCNLSERAIIRSINRLISFGYVSRVLKHDGSSSMKRYLLTNISKFKNSFDFKVDCSSEVVDVFSYDWLNDND